MRTDTDVMLLRCIPVNTRNSPFIPLVYIDSALQPDLVRCTESVPSSLPARAPSSGGRRRLKNSKIFVLFRLITEPCMHEWIRTSRLAREAVCHQGLTMADSHSVIGRQPLTVFVNVDSQENQPECSQTRNDASPGPCIVLRHSLNQAALGPRPGSRAQNRQRSSFLGLNYGPGCCLPLLALGASPTRSDGENLIRNIIRVRSAFWVRKSAFP